MNPVSCIPECPAQKGFVFQPKDGAAACAYSADPTKYVLLRPAAAVEPEQTLESLRAANSPIYDEYMESKADFEKNLALVEADVGKDRQIEDAFQELQKAENVRDKSPEAYQQARIRYYTLTKGDTWLEEERKRVASSEVDPKVAQYMSTFNSFTTQLNQQQKTKDAVNGVKDKVLSLRDEFQYSVNTLGNQLQQVRDQIQMERRRRETEKKVVSGSWIDILLNVLIVLALLFTILTIVRRVYAKPKQQPYSFAYPGIQY